MNSKSCCIYTSSGCNRCPNTLDWGRNGLVYYSACSAIHLWKFTDENEFVHVQSLYGHKKCITSVHWVKRENTENELIATSADHTASVWTLKEDKFTKTCTLVGHTNVVRNASGIYFSQNERMVLSIATLSTDSTLRIWQCIDDQASCIQTISFGYGFGLDVKFAFLPISHELVMLVGADDSKIHIYTQKDSSLFDLAVSLEGHENWIQCLDIINKDENTLLIASASQDCHIRLWKVVAKESATADTDSLKVDDTMFNTIKGHTFSVYVESVLSGHENWIHSVQWCLQKDTDSSSSLQILSASMDKTMIIWEADSVSNLWTEKIRVGEVGGNTLGFLGGVFSPCGKVILAHSYQGAIHVWKLHKGHQEWEPGSAFGGHFSSVSDIDWDPEGKYLISCSADQTTRIHAPFIKTNAKQTNWFEIARPQVHGYDMVCLAVLNRFQFVSAGDEKVLRIFQAPKSFAETLKNICGVDSSAYMNSNFAEGASVPSLGLSNKAVFQDDLIKAQVLAEKDLEKHPKDRYPDFYYTPTLITKPPTEETLIQNTLWPEVQKLYGHPYEVFTVAANHSGTLVASACKASKAEHAAIILWETSTWRQVGQLIFHNLTVTQLEFSPDDEFLLSVSRDRMWAVYRHFPAESPPYRKIAHLDKKNSVHARIIWSCSWTFDSLYFATASRDKKVAVWSKTEKESNIEFLLCSQPLDVEDSATALSFAPCLTNNNKYILATGLENGCIIISTWCRNTGFSIQQRLDETIAHHLTVNRLKFSPTKGAAEEEGNSLDVVQLASCSSDNHVKIYNIFISRLE